MKRPPKVTIVDFETLPIARRPEYPPKPVGVSIMLPGKRPHYFAWGHPEGNNCTQRDASRALADVWKNDSIVFHNAKFDVDVAQTHMGMGPIPWHRIHDTMFLLYLLDPHASSLGLKQSADRLLGQPPDERDAVGEWILANRKMILERYGLKITPKNVGAAIAYAPAALVGPYANGDCTRTRDLFNYSWPRVVEREMEKAYDRERELMPILLENERVGMRVDGDRLRRDVQTYTQALETCDVWLRRRLKVKELNLDNDGEVAEALSNSGVIADSEWALTKTGKRSVSKKNLQPGQFSDPRVASAFGYRNRLVTCLKMFMLPWERQLDARGDGHISTNWNQTRGAESGGTRTGRPSANDPNFLNISKTWYDKDDGYEHPAFLKIEELPLVRKYILPDKGGVFCHRDYNGQELRILGHFEDGALLQAYRENPRMDVHDFVRQLILDITGLTYHRGQVKITNFRRIYGGGAPATAGALGISMEAAKTLLDAHGRALPGVRLLGNQIKSLSASGQPIVTWGGREYYVEPPSYSERFKRHMTYEYKLLNYLIQGSAADATKQAILNYHNHPERTGRFMVTVYDEINTSSAGKSKAAIAHEMRVLRESMENLEFDVPMLSDGKVGPSWGDLVKYED